MTENDRYYYDSTRSIHSSIIGVEIFNDVEKPRRFLMAAIDQNSLHRGELKVFNAHTSNHQKTFRRASSVFRIGLQPCNVLLDLGLEDR